MKELKVKDIVRIIDGTLICGDQDKTCNGFKYDTREVENGDVFIRVGNEKEEGKQYWEMAFEAGADVSIINDVRIDLEKLNKWKDKVLIKTNDPLKGLQNLARYKRDMYGENFPVVAITGSVGKTSTKDMVYSVISQKFNTLKTQGNYNNHIGVPLTLLGLKDHEVAVVEMGMNHFGEISNLTNIAKPKIAVLTNIGTSHIGNLGSRENILKAKLEILEGMKEKVVVVNNDNDLLHKWKLENADKNIKIYTFGIQNESDVWAENIILNENSSSFCCHVFDTQFEVNVPVGGEHFVYNALCASLVGHLLGLDSEDIKKGIESFELTKNRMEMNKLKNGTIVINDAYNASLESIKASVKCLEEYKEKRKVAVIGDVFELGEFAEDLHRKMGKYLYDSNIDLLLCTGENSRFIVEEAEKEGTRIKEIKYFSSRENLLEYIKANTTGNDVILFKASNGMKFYELCPENNGSFEDIKLSK